MNGTHFWLDGVSTAGLPLPDRGFEFGDGLFETLRISCGRPLLLTRHMQRLAEGTARLGIHASLDAVEEQVLHVTNELSAAGLSEAAMRVTVVRGAGARGYRPDPHAGCRTLIAATPLEALDWPPRPGPATLCLAEARWPTQPLLAGLKHLNRLEQVLAADCARKNQTDEALMLDQNGRPVSVSAGNLYLFSNGALLTPSLQRCGIAGTIRAELLENLAPALGIPVLETDLTLEQVASADAVLYSNSLIGFRSVGAWQAVSWSDHTLADSLRNALLKAVQ